MHTKKNTLIEDEKRIAIGLKDFTNKNEFFVREEFLVPIFYAAGYSAFRNAKFIRDANLSKFSSDKVKKKCRDYIYPDYVLYFNGIPLWIVEAKSPKISNIINQNSIVQVVEYATKLKCPNIIITNALETYLYKLKGGQAVVMNFFTKEDVMGNKWSELINLLTPAETVRAVLTLNEALDLYQTDEYIWRLLIMRILNVFSLDEVSSILQENIKTFSNADSFRIRSLPAILISPHIVNLIENKQFEETVELSLNDSDPIVRENFFTCILLKRNIWHGSLPAVIHSFQPKTFLEKVLFLYTLTEDGTEKSHKVINKLVKNESFLKSMQHFIIKNSFSSFPIALLTNKPRNLSFINYYNHLHTLPRMIEEITESQNPHYETIKVLESCLSFCSNNNKEIFQLLLNISSKSQKNIILHYSTKKEFDDGLSHSLKNYINIESMEKRQLTF